MEGRADMRPAAPCRAAGDPDLAPRRRGAAAGDAPSLELRRARASQHGVGVRAPGRRRATRAWWSASTPATRPDWVHDAICEERVYGAPAAGGGRGRDPAARSDARPARPATSYGDAATVHAWSDPARLPGGEGTAPRGSEGWLDAEAGPRWVTLSESRYDRWDNVVATFEDGVWRHLEYDADAAVPGQRAHPAEPRADPDLDGRRGIAYSACRSG